MNRNINIFEQKILENYNVLMYQAKKLTRNQEDAEDLVQETIFKALKNKDNYVDNYVKAWLIKILTNLYIDRYRVKSKYKEEEFTNLPVATINADVNSGEYILMDENVESFVHSNLCENNLLAIFNLYRADYSYQEMADMLGKPIGTIKSSIHRAKKILETKIRR